MATVGNAHLEYYPAFCFKASPTHFSWVKMSAADVHRLHQPIGFKGQKVYFYKNYPIRFVTVVGVILQREEKARRTILLLDDSSGATLEIVALYSPERTQPLTAQNLEPADHPIAEALDSSRTMHITATDKKALDISALVPGTVAKIKGTLSQFRDTMQVVVEKFSLIKETNDEMRFLDERLRFLVGVLCEPWVLSEEEIELLEREAEREVSRAGDERRRAMERMKRRAEREEKDMRRIMRRYESDERAREREVAVCRENGAQLMDNIRRRKQLT